MLKHLQIIFTKKERFQLIFLLLAILIMGLLESVSIGLLIPLIDLFISPNKIQENESLNSLYNIFQATSEQNFIMLLAGFIIAFFIFKMLYSLVVIYARSKLISNFEIRISNQVLNAYLNKPYKFHLQHNSSTLFKNVTTEVLLVCQNFINNLLKLISEFVIVGSILIFLLIVYPLITFTALTILLVLGVIIYKTIQSGMKALSAERSQYMAEYFKTGMESLEGIKDVKVFNAKDFFRNRYRSKFVRASIINIKFALGQGLPRYFIETTLFIAFIGATVSSIYLGYASEDLIGKMAIMAAASVKIFPPIVNISQGITSVRFYSKNLEIIANILKESENIANELDSKQPIPISFKPLKIHNLSFSYVGTDKVLKNLSLEIIPYQSTAFVGESGSGKSTLIDILTGLLIPQEGAIFYGKEKITPENLFAYRAKIGYVPQQIFLYDDTLKANVAFGIQEQDIDEERVLQVLRTAQLDKLIKGLPEGLETKIGEKGVKLSGGQRQRIGIARALYQSPEILIFDEATSALDTSTELEVNKAIKKLSKQVTVIIVAHRINTIKQADYIYFLDKGELKARGTFDDLSENHTTFRKIVHADSTT